MAKVQKAGRVSQAEAHQKRAKSEREYALLQAALDQFTEFAANESGAPMVLLASAMTRYLGGDEVELVNEFAQLMKRCAQPGKSRAFDAAFAAP